MKRTGIALFFALVTTLVISAGLFALAWYAPRQVFIDYFLELKRTEVGRYLRSLEESGAPPNDDEPSAWEQNEYFDFF